METLKNLTLVQWIGIMVGLNSLLMGATPQLTVLLGAAAVPYIIAVATLANGALGVFVTVVGGQSAQVRNVLAMPGIDKVTVNGQAGTALASMAVDPTVNKIAPTPRDMDKVTAIAVKILMVAFLLSAFLAGDPAVARTKRTHSPDVGMSSEQAQIKLKSPKQIGQDIQDAFDRPLTTASNAIVSVLSKPLQDLANFLMTGLDEAAALAVAVPDLQDGNGQACWRTMAATGRILKEHPVPLTLKIAADLESFRLLTMAANRICQNAACTQVFTEAGNLVNAAAPMPLALPNLTVLCSKVPAIAIVAPQIIASPPTSGLILAPASGSSQGNPALGAGSSIPANAPAAP